MVPKEIPTECVVPKVLLYELPHISSSKNKENKKSNRPIRRKKMINHIDDLPKHAIGAIKVLQDIFKGTSFESKVPGTFLKEYNSAGEIFAPQDRFKCDFCHEFFPKSYLAKTYTDGVKVCEVCISKD